MSAAVAGGIDITIRARVLKAAIKIFIVLISCLQ
jgi:hypothetical protein